MKRNIYIVKSYDGAQAPLMRAKAVATPLMNLKADKTERGTI